MLTALAALLMLAAGPGGGPAAFPGPERELRSPDGAYAIIWWGPDAGSPNHSLLLSAPYTRKTWQVYSFARSVTVSWAPAEYVFAVTERLGDDRATTSVQSVKTTRPVDVCVEPQQALGDRWASADRRYCEHVGWTAQGELRLRLRGSGPGGAFDTQVTVPMTSIAW